jgi:aminoglycoside N3'-acetyltransferase
VANVRDQLEQVGVRAGGVLVVHTAFSKIAPIEGGPAGLIAALRATVGAVGTLVMPSMSDDDDHPFDVERTPCRGMGVVAEMFWRMPGVSRSDSPHSFAAAGPHAALITKPHPVEIPHGVDSPVGRAWELDAQVLLLGVGHDANTTIHLAENIAGVRYGAMKRAMVLRDDTPERIAYFEIDHCCERFQQMDAWLDDAGLQRRGQVGHGPARLVRARDVVSAALARLRADETVFLHAAGQCEECDIARAAIRPHNRSEAAARINTSS